MAAKTVQNPTALSELINSSLRMLAAVATMMVAIKENQLVHNACVDSTFSAVEAPMIPDEAQMTQTMTNNTPAASHPSPSDYTCHIGH